METTQYQVGIDGKWSLEDFYLFPHIYEQCYFMYLALSSEVTQQDDRVRSAYKAFPWQGGYSAVNFYNQLKFAVPKRQRPSVVQIMYSSPGLIELGSVSIIATAAIAKVVKSLCSAARDVNSTYSEVYRDMQQRKLLKMKTDNEIQKLTVKQQQVVVKHLDSICSILSIKPNLLNERTGSDYKSLKIVLSLYRRIRKIADYQLKGKIKLE